MIKKLLKNPVLAIALIGLLAGAGATGAILVGIVPTFDDGVNGSVSGEVESSPAMLVVSDPSSGRTFSANGDAVKFSADIGTLTAPGYVNWSINLTVNEVPLGATGIVVNMIGVQEPVRVLLNVSSLVGITHYRLGQDQWLIDAPSAADEYNLTFGFYADRDPALSEDSIPMLFDIEIALIQE